MKRLQRDWANYGPDTVVGRFLRWPLKLLPRSIPLPILSGYCRGLRWTLGSSLYSCWLGTYELDKQRKLAEFIREGMTVLDIGANTGFYTLLFAKAVGPSGHVYAFEPFPANAEQLARHVRINNLENVTLMSAAVSQSPGTASFAAGSTPYSGTLADAGTIEVPTVSIDHFIAEEHAWPDLIKMDIEGGETAAVHGAESLLSVGRTTWFIALHNAGARSTCETVFRKHGYRLFGLEGRELSTIPATATEIYALPFSSAPPRASDRR
jgi:FkbM family methyltransferase